MKFLKLIFTTTGILDLLQGSEYAPGMAITANCIIEQFLSFLKLSTCGSFYQSGNYIAVATNFCFLKCTSDFSSLKLFGSLFHKSAPLNSLVFKP